MTVALEVAGLRILGPAGEVLVRDVSVMARPGLPLTLLGETGSGKSLVLQAIMGTLPGGLRASGRILLDGTELLTASAAARRALWGRRIAILPQEPGLALDPTMRSLAQVAEVYRLVRGLPGPEALAEAQARLAELGLGQASGLYPFQLSGGMAQRLALAILRASAAPVVLADEPTKGLDAARRDEIARHLREAAEQGATMLVVTHDVAVARRLGGTLAVMREGVVVEQGPAATVLARPFHDYPRQLLAAEPAAWTMPRPTAVAGAVPQGDAVLE
ncbi:MAG: ATP-binding cassette domain-containing protein, partial [Acetobacteraceae bacterium]